MPSVEDTWADLPRGERERRRSAGVKRWKARWREAGRSRRKSFHVRKEALEWALAHETVELPDSPTPSPPSVDLAAIWRNDPEEGQAVARVLASEDRLTVAQALDVVQVIKDQREDGSAKPARRRTSRENSNHHAAGLIRAFGDAPITTLSRAQVISAVLRDGEQEIAKSSAAKRLQLMRRAFEVAGAPDPAVGYKVKIPRARRGFAMPMDQLYALSREIRLHRPSKQDKHGRRERDNADQLEALVILGGTLGPRITEMLNIDVGDLNVEASTITIRSTKTSEDEDEPLVRILAVPQEVMNYLEPLAKNQPDHAPLFRNQAGKRMDYHRIGRYVRDAGKVLGIEIHTHMLRHHAASTMLNSGVSIPTVSAILGHASSAVTLAVYSHPSEQRIAEATAQVGKALGEAIEAGPEQQAKKAAAEQALIERQRQAVEDRGRLTDDQWRERYGDLPF